MVGLVVPACTYANRFGWLLPDLFLQLGKQYLCVIVRWNLYVDCWLGGNLFSWLVIKKLYAEHELAEPVALVVVLLMLSTIRCGGLLGIHRGF